MMMPKFKEVPQLTLDGSYATDIPWDMLLDNTERWIKQYNLNMDPDFQRGHVWTDQQRREYVEFKLRGGVGSHEIRFNHPGWMRDFKGQCVLVDGRQRLEAASRFLRNEIQAFGFYHREYEDPRALIRISFRFMVNDLRTRADVLRWYLQINSGGTPHSRSELDRVRELWLKEGTSLSGRAYG